MTRVGVAAIALGLITGPQAVGVASADTADAGSATSASDKPARGSAAKAPSRAAKSTAGPAAASATANQRRAAVVDSAPARVPNSVASTLGGSAPSASLVRDLPVPTPTDKVTTSYGDLGKWMINSTGAIANWLGKPQPVNTETGTGTCPPCTPKTILEGINVVFVDTASNSAAQSARNLNAWLRQSGFGASAISSTGYQGYLGSTLYSQQPTGPSQAFRNSFFLFANSHARVFGPYPNQDGPGYVWTSSFSEENWTISNPLTHGYQSFMVAQTQVKQGMLAKGAQDLGTVLMENQYNVDDVSTGDATGYAQVLGLNRVLKAATGPRGASKTIWNKN